MDLLQQMRVPLVTPAQHRDSALLELLHGLLGSLDRPSLQDRVLDVARKLEAAQFRPTQSEQLGGRAALPQQGLDLRDSDAGQQRHGQTVQRFVFHLTRYNAPVEKTANLRPLLLQV